MQNGIGTGFPFISRSTLKCVTLSLCESCRVYPLCYPKCNEQLHSICHAYARNGTSKKKRLKKPYRNNKEKREHYVNAFRNAVIHAIHITSEKLEICTFCTPNDGP